MGHDHSRGRGNFQREKGAQREFQPPVVKRRIFKCQNHHCGDIQEVSGDQAHMPDECPECGSSPLEEITPELARKPRKKDR